MQPHTCYFVCGTPRSGSSLLCEALKNTGLTGRPEEYFWQGDEPFWRERWGVSSYADYLESAVRQGTTENGVFGAKLMMGGGYFAHFANQLQELAGASSLPVPATELVQARFPNLHYVWITRRNKVRQAVSWWKAIQSGAWSQTEDRPPRPDKRPEFNFEAIDHLVQELVMREASWAEYFGEGGIQPFVVVYEDLVTTYQRVARQLLLWMRIPAPPDLAFGPRKLRKQADELSEQWVMRYRGLKHAHWEAEHWEYVAHAPRPA
jgi:LPS sulfotransferase NodH